MNFSFKHFVDLDNEQLYQLLKLRTDVFVVEQDCPYPELDNKDLTAIHVYANEGKEVIAVARILPPGISYKEWSIGRVATHLSWRKKGLGKELMATVMAFMHKEHPKESIRISAQSHLEKFYREFDFKPTGLAYLEDGIPHIEMLFVPTRD